MMVSARVLEYSHGVAAAYCGKLLREAGWEVVRGPAPLPGPLDLYLGADKWLVDEEGVRLLAPLADLIITDVPGTFADVRGCVVTVTPFGATGPYAGFQHSEMSTLALSGLLYLIGLPEREPLTVPGDQASYFGGVSAALAAIAAILGGRWRGERIDVSSQEAVSAILENTLGMWQYQGRVRQRCGSQIPESGPCTDIYRTKDGHISLAAQTITQWQSLAAMIGRPELAEDPRFVSFRTQREHGEELWQILSEYFATRTTQEAFHEAQEWRIPVGPVNTLEDVLVEPQLAASGGWQGIEGLDVRVPARPYRTDDDTAPETIPPPRQAEAAGVAARWRAQPAPAASRSRSRRAGPLDGVRVIDMTAVIAGPLGSRFLADLGAEVIKIEAGVRPDMIRFSTRHPNAAGKPWEVGGWFQQVNVNKLDVALDLRDERAREILLELVRTGDVLMENFSQRVMGNFGLPYERLSEMNPRLVMVSMPGFGDRGPYKDYVAFGEIIEAMAGLSSLMGYRDGLPMRAAIAYGDPISGFHAAFAVMAALARRERTGKGAYMVYSHLVGTARFLGGELVATQQGRPPARLGNRHPEFVPHGTFPCRGEDRWIAIAVRDDREWQALAQVLGDGALATDPRFGTAAARRRLEDEIERRIAAATRLHDARTLMEALQREGVPAGIVSDGAEVFADPNLRARGFYSTYEQPGVGEVTFPGTLWHFAHDDIRVRRPAPALGEHTDVVLGRLLSLSELELRGLRDAGVTSDAVPLEGEPSF